MEETTLILFDKPYLRRPHMIITFAGWPDAGEVATGAVRYLIAKTGATRLGVIPHEPFYDFSVLRPRTTVEQGELKLLRFPSNDLFYLNDADHDWIFLLATEPHLRWETFVEQIVRVINEFGVAMVFSLGSMFDAVPHTKEPRVSGMASTETLRVLAREHGVTPVDYQGPASIHNLLHRKCQQLGLASISLWGHAPLYVRAPANPRVCWALLDRLSAISPLPADLTDLHAAGQYLTNALDKLMAQNDAIRLFVRRLEEQYEDGTTNDTLAGESTEQMIRDVEEFLRREQRHRGEPSES